MSRDNPTDYAHTLNMLNDRVQKMEAQHTALLEAMERLLANNGHDWNCEPRGGKCGWLPCAEARALMAADEAGQQQGEQR